MLDIAELIVFMGLVVFAAHSCLFQSVKFTSADPWRAVLLSLPILVTAIILMYSVNKVRYRNLIVASMLGALLLAALFGSHLEDFAANEFHKNFTRVDWLTAR
jgi:hypothetical protein